MVTVCYIPAIPNLRPVFQVMIMNSPGLVGKLSLSSLSELRLSFLR